MTVVHTGSDRDGNQEKEAYRRVNLDLTQKIDQISVDRATDKTLKH